MGKRYSGARSNTELTEYNMIELHDNTLHFRFPEVHEHAEGTISFIRTLRIPDDNREYPLPPGVSEFPLQHVDDYAERLPRVWYQHGGIFLPMYQAEAMWLSFGGDYPMAVKVAAGKINAITGEPWSDGLSSEGKQDYLVIPDQPWLDGFYAGESLIRQFVAMPLGEGYTAEEQLTGAAEHGGLQVVAYPMERSFYEELQWREKHINELEYPQMQACLEIDKYSMGFAPSGLMRQEIYEDNYGVEAWDQSAGSRCFVHLLNSVQYLHVTGHAPPTKPPRVFDYVEADLPWFDYYDADRRALQHQSKLLGLDSVAAKHIKKGKGALPGNAPLGPIRVKKLFPDKHIVREGDF